MISIKKKSLNSLFEFSILLFYIWYFLPIANVHLQATFFKLLFFAFLAIGIAGFLLCNHLKLNSFTTVILLYYIIFTLLVLLDIDDAGRTVRINFVFFAMSLIYFGLFPEPSKASLARKILILFAITTITSTIGVLADPNAARTISHADAGDILHGFYKEKNIAGIYLFQSLAYFVPFLVCLPKSRNAKLISLLFLILIFIVLVNASFTISLIVYFVALIISFTLKYKGRKRVLALIVTLSLISVVFINGKAIFSFIATLLNNEKVSTRIIELRDLIYSGVATGDAELRLDLYLSSLKTFIRNPFGVGAFYSYIPLENGIGYHSQILDDLARYGLFGLAFYILFFRGYYKALKKEYIKINAKQIAGIITVIYIAFLTFNIGFRSAEESIFMFLILPYLPTLINDIKQKKKNI